MAGFLQWKEQWQVSPPRSEGQQKAWNECPDFWKMEGPLKSHKKMSRTWVGCIHTHTHRVFSPFICWPELPLDLNFLVLSCWNWRLSCNPYWRKRSSSKESCKHRLLSPLHVCYVLLTSVGHQLKNSNIPNSTKCHSPEDKHSRSAGLKWWVLRSKLSDKNWQQIQ